MTQNVLVSAYPTPYLLLNSPNQQQKGNYIGYNQLLPSFQAVNLGSNPFVSSFQPRYVIPGNYTKGLNGSASESIPISGLYPAFQSPYYPSSFTLPPSWPSLTLSGLQQSSTNTAGGFSAIPAYQPAVNAGSRNTLTPITFENIYQSQQDTNAQYPAFPLTAYSQDYAQLGLPKYTHTPYGTNRGNKQGVKKPAPANEHKTSFREPSAKGRYQYSSKYSNPGSDFEDKESHTNKSPQKLDDSYDSEESSKSSDSYKSTDSSHKSNHEDDDDDGDYKNSFDFAEDKKRPQFTAPSEDNDESEESSAFPSRSCNFFNSSPSKAASSNSKIFSDDHHDFGPANFEDQFKAFAFKENFEAPDFNTESSKKVSDYYNNPISTDEKRLRMLYTQHSKVTDSYMTPTDKRETEIPKTLHYYNYKPPEYSYGGSVEYFPNSPFKPSLEQTRTHTSQHPPTDRDEETEDDESMTTAVTHRNKMYR
jgi:hypothetical protein